MYYGACREREERGGWGGGGGGIESMGLTSGIAY